MADSRYGGTVRVVATLRVDDLWPGNSFANIARLTNRTLFALSGGSASTLETLPVADLATDVPSKANGGLNADAPRGER
jgi:hypothetical protein